MSNLRKNKNKFGAITNHTLTQHLQASVALKMNGIVLSLVFVALLFKFYTKNV